MRDVLCPVMVARDQEMSALEDALLASLRGEGGVILLGGEAGMGKSRLATELSQRAARLSCTVMSGACSEAELSLPYLPFLEAIGNHLSKHSVTALSERLGHSAAELAHLFPQLGAPAAGGADPMQAKLRLFEALAALLRDAAAARGLLLVIEDLHWAEPATRELLDYLTRRLRATPVLVLATYRTDELHRKHPLVPTIQAWKRSGQASVIELSKLSPQGVAAMVCAIFDEREVSADFRDFLHERCEGNPFVVEEILRDARDRGHIFETADGWDRAEIADLRLGIPQTVRDTILLRLERLAPVEVEVLSAAAVVGRSCDLETIKAVTGLETDAVLAALQVCVNQQLLEEDVRPAGTFRFRHALTREAVYEDMVVPRRQQLHRRVAEAFRTMADRPAVDLAHHLLLAGSYAEAVDMCVTAAESAIAARAYRDAADLFERAAPHLAEAVARARLLTRAADAHWNNSESAAARRALEEAIPRLEAAGEMAEAARWRVLLGRCHWELQRSDLAREQYLRALEILEPLGAGEALATANIRLAGTYIFDGEVAIARGYALRALAIAQEVEAGMESAWSLNFLALTDAYSGDLDGWLTNMEESYRAAVAGGFHFQAANAVFNGCWQAVHLARGQVARAWLQRIGEEPVGHDEIWAPYLRALVALFSGEVPQAISGARDALARALEAGNEKYTWRVRVLLAHALCEAGLANEALRELPPLGTRVDLQDAVYDAHARIRVCLCGDDPAGAVDQARNVPAAACGLGSPADVVGEAGWADPQWLSGFLAAVAWPGVIVNSPRALAATAWLALAENRLSAARRGFEDAIDGFRSAGFHLDAWHAGRGLARCHALLGSADAASTLLHDTVREARAAGAVLAARLAYETSTDIGVTLSAAPMPASEAAEPAPTGERLVTVLFADVRGYTARAGALAPADLGARIESLQKWVVTEVRRHRGLVDKFAGDAVMATFNVSGATVDHTLHALRAGLAIRDKAALLDMPVGVGIAVGSAIVGRLAAGANMSVIGEATNLAARLQTAAGPGDIVLSSEARRRVEGWLSEQGLEAFEESLILKGIAAPVTAFRLRAPNSHPA